MSRLTAPRLRLPATLALLLACLFAATLAWGSWRTPGFVDLERLAYDLRLAASARAVPQHDRILLVLFDEDAVAATERRAPLDRRLIAQAVQRLDRLGARTIAVDILIDQATTPEEDFGLAQALAATKAVWLADDRGADTLLKPWQRERLWRFLREGNGGSLPIKSASAALFPDSDGVVRRSGPPGIPSLADVLARAQGVPARTGEIALDYRRADRPPLFATLGVLDLVRAPPEADTVLGPLVAGRLVLLGADLDNVDRHRTPLSGRSGVPTPGVEVHAQVLATLLDRSHSPAGPAPGWFWLFVLMPPLLGVGVGWIQTSAAVRVGLVLGATLILLAASIGLEAPVGVQTYGLPVTGAALSWLLVALVSGSLSGAATNRERQLAREVGLRYLPPDVARLIERRPELLDVHGRRRPIAIVFTDLAGFTTLSETLGPDRLSEVLNGYLDGMTEVVLAHGGTLDKFIGDAVVCFWGAPLDDPQAARRALDAALDLQAFARRHRAELAEQGLHIGETRIGAHYGEAVVGNFGSRRRVQYTAMGDAMNLAARLESANKQMGTEILASGEIIAAADWTRAREIGRIAVRGREEPCAVFQLDTALEDTEIAAHRSRLAALRAGDPAGAEAVAAQLQAQPEDAALAGMAARAAKVGWEGVWTLESK